MFHLHLPSEQASCDHCCRRSLKNLKQTHDCGWCPVHNTSGDHLGTVGLARVSIQNTYRLHSNRFRCHCEQRRSGGSAMRLTMKQDPNIPHSPGYTSVQHWPVSLITPLNGCVCERGVSHTGEGGWGTSLEPKTWMTGETSYSARDLFNRPKPRFTQISTLHYL